MTLEVLHEAKKMAWSVKQSWNQLHAHRILFFVIEIIKYGRNRIIMEIVFLLQYQSIDRSIVYCVYQSK